MGKPERMTDAVYRGWMMHPERYEDFYGKLLKQNIRLVVDPEAYRRLHIFPNVYEKIKADTAPALFFELYSRISLSRVFSHFRRFMVKDFVKSVKGTEFPRFFDENTTQETFDHWMDVFYELRDEEITDGICVKEYRDLKRYGGTTNEWRVFYMNQVPATVTLNSLHPESFPAPDRALIEKYTDLESPFYTLDFAELADGGWMIVEAGDGGVSGLCYRQDIREFYAIMAARLFSY
jgi:hypothetical protein